MVAAPAFAIIEPPPEILPTETDQCKEYGWVTYDGIFKNQGDCVSYVVTDGSNEPAGSAVQ